VGDPGDLRRPDVAGLRDLRHPGFGVAGIAGIILLFGGLVMTFVGNAPGLPGLWQLPQVREGVRNGVIVVVTGLIVTAIFGSMIRRFLPKVPFFRRLIL